MVGAESRPVHGLRTSTKPDIVWEYESDPRIELTCGHAISNYHILIVYSTFYCPHTFSKYFFGVQFQLLCFSSFIAPDNLFGLIREKILQNDYCLRCPGKTDYGTCGQIWNNVDILQNCVLSSDEFIFFCGKLSLNFLNNRQKSDIKLCPGCNSFCERLRVIDSHVKCYICSSSQFYTFKFCWHCLQIWTHNHVCYAQNDSINNVEIRRQLIECPKVTLDYSHMTGVPSKRLCPNCKTLLQHDQACKSMLCTFCKTEFCFACLKTAINGKLTCGEFDGQCIVAPIQSTD